MIEIPGEIRDRMLSHAFEGLPNEACGLLAGRDGRAEAFYPMRNADDSPMTYRLEPTEQLQVFEEIESKGWDVIGIFHSHTHTEAYPSETDRRQAFYPDAHYLLVSLQDHDRPVLRGFTIVDGQIEEQEVRTE
ncbi:MAG TPA: M67 family metallopeptidase [Actinomycetota bacterium]|nr:M67 family metallopeptidase [Actinomycetota bacterium]